MLNLAEELLLLALDDDKGSMVDSGSRTLPYGLSGALLLDLLLQNRLSFSGKKIAAIDMTSTGDAFLDEALQHIQSKWRKKDAKYWVQKLNNKMDDLQQRLLDDLAQRGVLRREKRRLLWLIPYSRFPENDPAAEQTIREEIRRVVFEDQTPDERSLALVSLVQACDLEKEVFAKGDREEAKERIKELTEGERVGRAVSAIATEIIASVTIAVYAGVYAATAAGAGH